MWLLCTERAELFHFVSPESVPGGYAILSHVWEEDENTLQEIRALKERCTKTGENPRDLASAKIRKCCELAERHGYHWIWIDTCCIDKTSSAELSEAINSMFRYYSLAEVCYAYLRDVPRDRVLDEAESTFRKSRWHMRGWTLQELIAPKLLLFLSADWEVLGTKAELSKVLEEITKVPRAILESEEKLENISNARRMSWAASRQTTRLEDEAYCLMGIFGINMPTLYGEGPRAFWRLQEEIMKQSTDTTLFAWGRSILAFTANFLVLGSHTSHVQTSYVFASSPSQYKHSIDVDFMPFSLHPRGVSIINRLKYKVLRSSSPSQLIGTPTFTITPQGILARLRIFEVKRVITVAVMPWTKRGSYLGLILVPCPDTVDPKYPLYDIGGGYTRLVELGDRTDQIYFQGTWLTPKWREVYLARELPRPNPTSPILANCTMSTPFRLPEWHIRTLLERRGDLVLLSQSDLTVSWRGVPPMTLRISTRIRDRFVFVVHLGTCTAASPVDQTLSSERQLVPSGPHWAYVELVAQKFDDPPLHDCLADHVSKWRDGTKRFRRHVLMKGFGRREDTMVPTITSIQLSCTPCPLNPSVTFVVRVSLVHDQPE